MLLEDVVTQMRARLDDLRPQFDEYNRLVEALAKLNGSTRKAPTGKRGRGRPKGSGGTQARLLEVVRTSPGLTIGEIAARLEMAPNYLYRALPTLAHEGQVFQAANKTWHPTKQGSE